MADTMTKEAFEQTQYDEQNKMLIQQLIDAEDGECKQAASASSQMIRRVIRENGFMRKIIPPKQISDSDLNRLLDTEKPAILRPAFRPAAVIRLLPRQLATWIIPGAVLLLF